MIITEEIYNISPSDFFSICFDGWRRRWQWRSLSARHTDLGSRSRLCNLHHLIHSARTFSPQAWQCNIQFHSGKS
ncbi:hypothetical protein LINGRAHAP2_LOCUS35845 [Linum grandiflorum]